MTVLDRLLKKSRVFFAAGDLQKTRAALLKAIPEAEGMPETSESLDLRIRLYNNLSAVCSRTFDFPNAKRYILKASQLAQQIEPLRWDIMVVIYSNMGVLEKQESNLDNARMNFQLAKTHLCKIEDPIIRKQRAQEVQFNLAQLYLRMGMLEDAFAEIRELNENPPESDYERDVIQARQHMCTGRLVAELANDPKHQGEGGELSFTEQSIEQFESALRIYERLDDRYKAWLCSVSILRSLLDAGKIGKEQEAMLTNAEDFARENPTDGMQALILDIRTQYHIVRNEHDIARKMILDFLEDPPNLAPMNLVQVQGKMREHAMKMQDERLVEMLDHAIHRVANSESGGYDPALN